MAAGLVVSTLLGITAAPAPASAGPATPAQPANQPANQATRHSKLAPGSYSVTLITGDRATLAVGNDGRTGVTLEPATRPDGSTPTIRWYSAGDGVYVIPDDVQSYVDSGQMDEKLFDIEYLAANKYESRAELPLIVEYAGAVKPLPATAKTVPLNSVGAAKVTVQKGHLNDFWGGLVKEKAAKEKPTRAGPGKAPAARASTSTFPLPNGVERIWLDRVAKVVLDQSVPQINAPQAWQAGFTGAGVKVAVLDTGIDATHPDLAGKVVASRNFVDTAAQPLDGHGHGTHVASTVAGSGAASGGKYVGVAPDAQLVIGKVCDNGGSCTDSDMIAGMEWAAIEQQADVVSMSIGGCCSDGTDPLSQAVNALTAQTGALFVIAAGNDGPGTGTIGSPGTADAALTVAAVSKSDQLADFSSRGPRGGNWALKPEIAAPGVGIVAARGTGTSMGVPVGDRYTSSNGTSMATPHVSGAAALLVQQHPDWRAEQLKAALVGSAQDVGYSVYEQGAGRVDIGRATRQLVQVSPAVADFGFLAEPQQGPALTRTLTYTNPTAAPVTLNVSAALRGTTGAELPTGAFTVDSGTLTVPAGGTASVTATLNYDGLGAGLYTGSLVATNEAADLRLTSPVGLTIGAQTHRVTVTAVSRDCAKGVACTSDESSFWFGPIQALRIGDARDQSAASGRSLPKATRITLQPTVVPGEVQTYQGNLPAGEYLLQWTPGWQDATDNRWQSAEIIAPELHVTGPTELRLDANTAVKTTFEAPKPIGENISANRVMHRLMSDGSVGTNSGSTYAFGSGNMWTNPIEPLSDGKLLMSFSGIFTAPPVTMTVKGKKPVTLNPIYPGYYPKDHPHVVTPIRFPAGTRTSGLVNVGRGTAEDLANVNVSGKLALLHNDLQCAMPKEALQRLLDAGAVGVLFDPKYCRVPNFIFPWTATPDKPQIPYVSLPMGDAERLVELLRAGPVDITVTSTPLSPYTYFLTSFEKNGVPVRPHYRFGAKDLATVEANYHSRQSTWIDTTRFTWHPGETLQISQNYAVNVPTTMTEYWSVDPNAEVWRQAYNADLGAVTLTRVDVFTKPERRVEHWNSDPMVPGAASRPTETNPICAGCRDGDTFWPHIYLTNDDPAYNGGIFGLTIPVSNNDNPWAGLHLYRDGNEIPVTPFQGFYPSYTLPADTGRYRLVMDADAIRNRPQTVWDFVSRGTADSDTVPGETQCLFQALPVGTSQGCRAEPLIFLRYSGLGLNLRNEATAPGRQRFEVTAYRQASTIAQPRIAGLKVWTSYDGGATWTGATVKQEGNGRYSVVVTHPSAGRRASDTVSIRAEAWDSDGNRVQQTVRDAFRLAGRSGGHHRNALVD